MNKLITVTIPNSFSQILFLVPKCKKVGCLLFSPKLPDMRVILRGSVCRQMFSLCVTTWFCIQYGTNDRNECIISELLSKGIILTSIRKGRENTI